MTRLILVVVLLLVLQVAVLRAATITRVAGLAIPDDTPAGVSSTITVTDPVVITDVDVAVQIGHTFRGDLVVTLRTPWGADYVLHDRRGDAADDLRVSFDTGAAPEDPLRDLNGEQGQGGWTLTVSDQEAGDTGVLESWSLVIEGDRGEGTAEVAGTVRYEKRVLTSTGFTSTAWKPLRYADVELVNADDGTILGSGRTDGVGAYLIETPRRGTVSTYVRVYARANDDVRSLTVLNDATAAATHTVVSSIAARNTSAGFALSLDIPWSSGAGIAGAFNIVDALERGCEYVNGLGAAKAPLLVCYWKAGSTAGTYYAPDEEAMYILGSSSDTDEFDDSVILHEFGHFVAHTYAVDDSPGGSHYWSDASQDLRLSWSEGWATWFCCAVVDSNLYLDSYGTSSMRVLDLELPSYASTALGGDTEVGVMAVLWDLVDGAATPDGSVGTDDDPSDYAAADQDVWTVYTQAFPTGYPAGCGVVSGFYEGWLSRLGAGYRTVELREIMASRSIASTYDAVVTDQTQHAIPSSSYIEIPLVVNASMTVTRADVFVYIDHPSPSDLTVSLVYQDGTTCHLHNKTVGTASDGIVAWYAPFERSSAQALSVFNGKAATGLWRLRVADADTTQFPTQTPSRIKAVHAVKLALLGTPNTADLVVDAVTAPATALRGSTVTVTSTLRNRGGAAISQSFQEAWYLSSDRTVAVGDLLLGTFAVGGVSARSTVSNQRVLTIPSSVAAGPWYLGVIADWNGSTGTVTEFLETNNAGVAPAVTAVGDPAGGIDLYPSSVDAPASATLGATMTLSVVVANGGGAASGPFVTRWYLSSDAFINPGEDRFLGEYQWTSLPFATSRSETRVVTVPSDLAPGPWYAGVVVDAAGAVVETNEANNTGLDGTPVVLGARPEGVDVVVDGLGVTSSAWPGATVTAQASLRNGGGTAAASWVERWYLSADDVLDDALGAGDDVLLGSFAGGPLAVDATVQSSRALTVGLGQAPGSYHLGLVVDALDDVNPTNSRRTAPFTVATAPTADLVPTNVISPTFMVPGANATVTYSLANTGGTASVACSVDLYLSVDTVIVTTEDRFVARVGNPAIPAGGGGTYTVTVFVPADVVPGTYHLGVVADALGEVGETDETNNSRAAAATVVVTSGRLPDLTPTNVAVPAVLGAGRTLSVSWRTLNRGRGATSSSFLSRFYLSSDAVPSVDDTLLGEYQETGTLLAGADVYRSTVLTVPASVPSAPYHVWVTADASGVVLEELETNNTAVSATTVVVGSTTSGVDLVPGELQPPPVAALGNLFAFTASVANIGQTATVTPFRVDVYLSADTDVTAADAYLTSVTLGGLLAGGTSVVPMVATVPSGLTTGTWYLGAIVDAGLAVAEDVETNNAGASLASMEVVSAAVIPDLLPLLVSGPLETNVGGAFTAEVVAANYGNLAAGAFDLMLVLSVDGTATTSDAVVATFPVTGLPGMGVTSASVACTVPLTLPAGTYNLGLVVDAGDTVVEWDETNNGLVAPRTLVVRAVSAPPDLVATGVVVDAWGSVGGRIGVERIVKNVGKNPTGTAFPVGYYLSSDQALDAGDVLLASVSHPAMDAGAQDRSSVTLTVPAGAAPGVYWLLVVVDDGDVVAEGVEINNVAASVEQVTIAGRPDLVIEAVSAPSPVTVGQPLTISRTVRNIGSAPCLEPIVIRYYLSNDDLLTTGTGGDPILCTEAFLNAGGLAPGAATVGTTSVTVPPAASAWTYYLGAYVDILDEVAEENEANNATTSPLAVLSVVGAPDLRALAVTSTSTGVQGTPIVVTLSVSNYQNTTAPAFTATCRLSADRVYDIGDAFLGSIAFGTLQPGASVTASGTFTIPAGVVGGRFTVAWVDPEGTGSIYETVEGAASNAACSATSSVYREPDTTPPAGWLEFYRGSEEIPDPLTAGSLLIMAVYDEPIGTAPSITIDEPGTADVGPVAMTPVAGDPTSFFYSHVVAVADGAAHVDGWNTVTVTGALDLEGNPAAPLVDGFQTDTVGPMIEVTTPEPLDVSWSPFPVATVPAVVYTLAGTADDDSDVILSISVNYGPVATTPVTSGDFSTVLTFLGTPPETATGDVVVIQARDTAGNAAVPAVLRVFVDGDGDGMPDYWELLYPSILDRTDPADGTEDPDLDGLDNYEEWVRGTNPTVYDNVFPVANAGPDQEGWPGLFRLDGSLSHPAEPGPTLTYLWTYLGGPVPSVTLSPSSASVTPTFLAPLQGTYSFSLQVFDGTNWGIEDDVDIEVLNTPPMAHAGFDRVTTVGSAVTLDGSRSVDPDGGPLTYLWTEDTDNAALGLTFTPSAAVASPTVVPPVEGTYVFWLEVDDADGEPAPVPASVTVVVSGPAGMPPTADAGPVRTVTAPGTTVLDGRASVSPITTIADYYFDTVAGPTPLVYQYQDEDWLYEQYVAPVRGRYDVVLWVQDGAGLSGPLAVTHVMAHGSGNRLPSANAGADQSGLATGTLVTLDGRGSMDPEGATLLTTWEQVEGPPVRLDGVTTLTPSFIPLRSERYTFRLFVSDDAPPAGPATRWYDRDDVVVHVDRPGNVAPLVTLTASSPLGSLAGGRLSWAGGVVTLNGTGTVDLDAGPSPLALRWVQRKGPWVVLSNDEATVATFTPLVGGAYAFDLVAWDGAAETRGSVAFVLDTPANTVPVVVLSSTTVTVTNWTGGAVTLDGSGSYDPDGGTLVYSWEQVSGPWAVIANPGAAVTSFVPVGAGTYVFALRVGDGTTFSAPVEVTVTVSGAGGSAAAGGGGGGGCSMVAVGEPAGLLLPLLGALGLVPALRRRRRRTGVW